MAGRVTVSTINDDTGVLATQNGMTGIAKAWVNFNGTGTPAILGSFNVSSITDNGTGNYTLNFTNAMPNTSYSTIAQVYAGGNNSTQFRTKTEATSSVQLSGLVNQSGTAQDAVDIDVAIFSS